VKRTSVFLGIALALACAVSHGQSFAAEATPEERAEGLKSQAYEAATSGRNREALNALYGAWALAPSFKIACNIGRIEALLGGMRAAAEFLTICKELRPRARTLQEQARDERAEKALAQALEHVATLQIEVNEPGAEVLVDGKAVGRAPMSRPVFVEPGRRRVTARLAGREAAAVEIDGSAGASIPVRLLVQPVAPRVIVPPVVAPTHVARPSDKKPLVAPVMAPEPPKSPLPSLAMGLGAGAVLTVGAGVLFSALKGIARDGAGEQLIESQKKQGDCPASQCGAGDALAKRDVFGDLEVVSFAAAASLGATVIGIAVFGLKRASEPPSAVARGAVARGVTVLEW
jgi:hypothetical protein